LTSLKLLIRLIYDFVFCSNQRNVNGNDVLNEKAGFAYDTHLVHKALGQNQPSPNEGFFKSKIIMSAESQKDNRIDVEAVCSICNGTGYKSKKHREYYIPGNPALHLEIHNVPCPKGCLGKILYPNG